MRVLALLLALAAIARGGDGAEVTCRVAYADGDGFYVDAGSSSGLAEGDLGFLRPAGAEPVQVQVVAVSSSSARVRFVGPGAAAPSPGDLVVFRTVSSPTPPPETGPPATPPGSGEERPFVPLLDQQRGVRVEARPRNVSHGWVGLRQVLHEDFENGYDYATTILGSRGGIDRIGGSAWALRWNGNLSYRSGSAFQDSPLEGAHPYVFELSIARSFDADGFLRFGRILPAGLRVGGFLDGLQVEHAVGGFLRIGAVAGLRPEREDLVPSLDEPTGLLYATAELGRRGDSWFSGTAGVLGAWYEGEFDRLAVLSQVHYEYGRRFRIDATVDVDFDAGSSLYKSGTQLSLLDVVASADFADAFTLRGGLYRFERLDNAAQRAQSPGAAPEVFLDAFWRAWMGGTVRLGSRWSLECEVAGILDEADRTTLHWRGRAVWFRPLGLEGSNLALTVYNLDGSDGSGGLGARLDAYLAFSNRRWMLLPSIGVRWMEQSGADFTYVDARLRLEHGFGRGWSAYVDLSYATGEAVESGLLELGVNYYW